VRLSDGQRARGSGARVPVEARAAAEITPSLGAGSECRCSARAAATTDRLPIGRATHRGHIRRAVQEAFEPIPITNPADTGIGEIIGIAIYEPLEEPVPPPKRGRRPVTASRPAELAHIEDRAIFRQDSRPRAGR
jgi:hypothetical protein